MSILVSPVSPELALVCPELRREWIAALPEIDPEALFRPKPLPPRPAAPERGAAAPERRPPVAVAAAAYLALNVLQWLVWGSVTFGLVALATLLLTLAGSA